MKKLLLVATLGVAGFMSAKSEVVKSDLKTEQNKSETQKGPGDKLAACSSWITITSPCLTVYYLCADNYSDSDELAKAIAEINDQKCN